MAALTLHNLIAHIFNHVAVLPSKEHWTTSVVANNNQKYNQNLAAVSAKIPSRYQHVLGACHGHTAMPGRSLHRDTHTYVHGLNLIVITDFVKTKLQGKTEA